MRTLFIASILFFSFTACSNSDNSSNKLEQEINGLVAKKQFNEALQILSNKPSTEEIGTLARTVREANQKFLESEIGKLKQTDLKVKENTQKLAKAYLDFGIFLEYYGEHLGMRDRMTMSLANFRRCLQLDPNNEKAQAEIEQIEAIYKQMGREVPGGIAN